MAQDEGAVFLLEVLDLVTPKKVPIFCNLLEAPHIIFAGELGKGSPDDLFGNGSKEVRQLDGTILSILVELKEIVSSEGKNYKLFQYPPAYPGLSKAIIA